MVLAVPECNISVKIGIICEENHKSATKWQKKNVGMEFVNIQTEEFNLDLINNSNKINNKR